MIDIPPHKHVLVDKLWLTTAQKWSTVLRPRVRKNKRLKLLTLTNDASFEEVTKLEEEELTEKECVVAWTHSHIKKLRLETEISPARVIGIARYETCASNPSFVIKGQFPFDIVNLDFSSQEPVFELGRVEEEIRSLEDTIKLQSDTGGDNFIMVYTTVLNSNDLDYSSIVHKSNNMPVLDWSGLSPDEFPTKIAEQVEKMRCIEATVSSMCFKYKYNVEIESQSILLSKDRKYMLCSIAVFAHRG